MDDECVKRLRKLKRVTELIQGKWTLQILRAMSHGPVRLSQLRRFFPLASKKALGATLKSLEQEGIIVRRDLSNTVLHVEYDFTDAAKRAIPDILEKLAECGEILDRTLQIASDGKCSAPHL